MTSKFIIQYVHSMKYSMTSKFIIQYVHSMKSKSIRSICEALETTFKLQICSIIRVFLKSRPFLHLHRALLQQRGIVTFNFSPRNLTQVTSTMKPGQDSMFGFFSVKRITLREGLY